jgi:hypothetical protein
MAASRVIVVENPTSVWLILSAVIQALAAVAIALLTFFLVRFTGRYVQEMRTANELQDRANAISSGLLARAAKQDAPFLIAASTGGSGSTGGKATFGMVVENRGGGLAHDIEIDTTWGKAQIPSLAAGDKAQISLQTDNWGQNDQPQVTAFRFKDATDTEWVQSPNQMPVQASA